MNKSRRTMLAAIVLSGSVGLVVGPTWAQQTPAPGTEADRPGSIKQKDDPQRQQPGKAGTQAGRQKDDAVRQQDKTGTAAREQKGAPGQEGQRYSRDTVKEAQQALQEKGHNPGPIDGLMGPNTRQAIRAFQKEQNIKATGNLDQETAQRLGVTLDGRAPGTTGDMPRTKSPAQKGGQASPEQRQK